MLARPSLENLISLWAPLASVGTQAALVAARRSAREEEWERWCMAEDVVNDVAERKLDEQAVAP